MSATAEEVHLHWAAVPFPRPDERGAPTRSGVYWGPGDRPIQIPGHLVEELGFEELITFARLTLWHDRKEASNMRRLADEVWYGEMERAAMWVSQLQERGLVVCSETYQRGLETLYPEMREQRLKREGREQAARELAERREQEQERRDKARAEQERRREQEREQALMRSGISHEPTEEDGSWIGPWPLVDEPRPPKGQAVVYVLFSARGRAVYVGSTDNFLARMKAHQASGKRWTTWTALPCADREEAYDVEAEYLDEYMPQLNVQGPQRRSGDR
jgi:GIY-YIG catalytic domain-containing protein